MNQCFRVGTEITTEIALWMMIDFIEGDYDEIVEWLNLNPGHHNQWQVHNSISKYKADFGLFSIKEDVESVNDTDWITGAHRQVWDIEINLKIWIAYGRIQFDYPADKPDSVPVLPSVRSNSSYDTFQISDRDRDDV